MSVRIRGKKREEIIQNWLQGRESDEFDVIPTKNEGKYIIRHKVKNNHSESNISEQTSFARDSFGNREENETEQNISETPDIQEQNIQEQNIQEQNIPEQTYNEPESFKHKKQQSFKLDHGLGTDILNQLKNIQSSFHEFNEERRKKQEKKAKKKEMKHIIHKEFAKNRVMIEDSDDDEEYKNNEPQIVYVEKPAPIRTRRRLNLLNRYK